jgi:hypothetical protein
MSLEDYSNQDMANLSDTEIGNAYAAEIAPKLAQWMTSGLLS